MSEKSEEIPEGVCRVCRKPMPLGAAKCSECDSFQDWRRHVLTWSGLVAACLALVPLWNGAAAIQKIAFPEPPEIETSIQCAPEEIRAYVVNAGGSSAMLGLPVVTKHTEGENLTLDVEVSENDNEDFLSKPDEPAMMTLMLKAGDFYQEGDNCVIDVSFPIKGGLHKKRGIFGGTLNSQATAPDVASCKCTDAN